jgi:hypothetical protein
MGDLNLDLAAEMNIYNARANTDWPEIELTSYENDGVTPQNFLGDYKMIFSETQEFKTIAFEFTVGHGLTITANVLTIKKPTDINPKAAKYFHLILNKTDSDEIFPVYKGITTVIPGQPSDSLWV